MDSTIKPGLKASQIEKCALCKRGVCHSHQIHFYRITVEQHIVDQRAVQRRAGMEMMMGGGQAGAVLAGVLGTDDPITHTLPADTITVCGECALMDNIGAAISAAQEAA